MELGDYPKAKEAYEKALQLDQYNTIAKKNLQRLAHLGDDGLLRRGQFGKGRTHIYSSKKSAKLVW